MIHSLYAIFGASGFGREVLPLARQQLLNSNINSNQLVFIDDLLYGNIINGCKVISYSEFLLTPATEHYVCIAISNNLVRQKLTQKCLADGLKLWTVCASNIVSMDAVSIGAGAILCHFVTLTSNIRIGIQFHANIYSYVAHDCIIGDYVTFAPGVKCNGNVTIKSHVYVGTGAIIKQGNSEKPLVIGEGAIIGMGAVVTKDIPSGTTVVGNPAKIMNNFHKNSS